MKTTAGKTEWVVIYTTSAFNCPWCTKVKELLNCYGIDFYEKDINSNPQYLREFKEAGHTHIPQVYIEGTLIGGYDATKKYARNRYFDKYDEEKRAKILVELDEID